MTALSATAPAKPPKGQTLIVEVFPLVAPGERRPSVLVMIKPGVGGGKTVIVSEPEPGA
jgi:hypothetical protein